MTDPIKLFLKELFPNKWETVRSELEDTKCIQQRLIGMMHRCMPSDDYALFSLSVRAVNDLIDEEIAETQFEEYVDSHDDEDLDELDVLSDGLPLSRFHINFQKFQSLVIDRYGWIFDRSSIDVFSICRPENHETCDSYLSSLAFQIHLGWESIESSVICKHRESIISEALAILNRKWEEISVADYDKAIEMLRSINAYPELINTLREWIFIKGENGWKVKRSDPIEALRLEEEATYAGDNVTLEDWANLYEYDSDSAIKPNKTKSGILESFYNQGSGLAALILGDLRFEDALWPIKTDFIYDVFTKKIQPDLLKNMANELKEAFKYYEDAVIRGYAIGYRAQSIIYSILDRKDIAEKLEQKYSKAPYANKRAVFNLLRDYKTTYEYEERKALIENGYKDENGEPCRDWLIPLPLSLLALVDENKAKENLYSIFDNVLSALKQYM